MSEKPPSVLPVEAAPDSNSIHESVDLRSAKLQATSPSRSASDAFVFFGATGDLAYKQIFPALQQMIRHGSLNVPVIGVAKAGWTLDQLKQRAHDSLAANGGVDQAAFEKLAGLLKYIDGDYKDSKTFEQLRSLLGSRETPDPLPRDPSQLVWNRR